MENIILVDTSPLIAILSPQDNYHKLCVDTLKTIKPPLLTTWAVITETLWLIRHNRKAIQSLFKMIEGGLVQIDPLSDNTISWLNQFMLKYHDMGVQVADASLCYLGEIYNLKVVFTLR
ncbi:PIN domain-containing protein [Cyanobacterium aponinum UTEX 3222]|uniref:PIN domain-containing protein n=1 Tax=Cyanobacterium aponinum (strain PCC 10605) TaxID=755178 RepID=K9Z7E1_CYAAP|nr:PIN domain-containing protein [Cyanobacterium aponinum]AFZ54495.1 PIN domain-containing protein [Cyanobacterium aponinum PCC 10605]WRL43558.1 PIN domain-containing protein [Cyanobacterium aponinum UTEX 3222]